MQISRKIYNEDIINVTAIYWNNNKLVIIVLNLYKVQFLSGFNFTQIFIFIKQFGCGYEV